MKKLVFLTLFLPYLYTVFCQQPKVHLERISDQQGLYDLYIKCLLQDSKGFIWIGGENGLYLYDGYNIVMYKDPPGCKDCPPFLPVYDLVEDSLGMLWILSYKGITVYDHENERSWIVYRFRSAGASSGGTFLYSRILDLNLDPMGNIWATGDKGLIRFSYKKDFNTKEMKFDSYPESFLDIDFLQLSTDKNPHKNIVLKIYTDSEGDIWAGSEDGLYVMRTIDSGFHRFEIEAEMKSESRTYISDILEQDKDTFWILSGSANYIMSNVKKALYGSVPDVSALRFTKFLLEQDMEHSIMLSSGRPLFKDSKNNIFVGINEVMKYTGRDKKGSLTFEPLTKFIADYYNYSSDVRSILEDRSGMMWIAYQRTGIAKFNPAGIQFLYYYNSARYNLTTLNSDFEGNIWMGAFNSGLYRIRKGNGLITRYDLGLYGNQIVCMIEKNPGIFWIGTSRKGVLEFNSFTGKFHSPLPESVIADRLRNTQVNNILKDGDQFYFATSSGIYVYDFIKQRIVRFSYPDDSSVYLNNWTISPIRLNNGEIIVFTSLHGISKVNYDDEHCSLSVTCIIPDSILRRNNINLSRICKLYQDSHGAVWMIEKSGLKRIDLKKSEIHSYRLFDEIDYPEAWSILEDSRDNLWIGTHFGLCRFNTKTGQVKNFTEKDGVPISFHDYNAAFKDSDGMLYFGGTRGFYSFHPDSIKSNTYVPPVVITDFRLFNKSVLVDTSKNSILTKNISYTREVQLHHDQNDISFEFAALDYTLPSGNQYAYKLEGYQDKWVETDANNRVATYTNLDPGTYIFKVKGSNCDGVWNEAGTSLTIIIRKPWWGTNIAWAGFALIFICSIGAYIRWRVYRLKREKIYLEHQVHERTLQIEDQKEKILSQRDTLEQQNKLITEHEQLKSRFFANISHEFRTPLSLIQSPVEEMLDDPRRNEKERRKLNMVHRNARRLLNLVNQLLDISKIDGSKMKLELVEDDVMKYLRAITGSFCSLAESKRIRYSMHFPSGATKTWFDPDKLEKITTNLLSNAFRFTPLGGEINFSAGYIQGDDPGVNSCLEFSVQDSGSGIPEESLGKIFDRFYQVEESLKKEGGGTGIGLSLSRDIVSLMYGDIKVQSKPGEGSTFTVILPLGREHLKESEFTLLKEAPETIGFINELHEMQDEALPEQVKTPGGERPIVLIVEDNRDIRTQLSDNLTFKYLIQEASNGITGLKKATEMIPDLILTDLMMPGMDGMELCQKLKSDERTSHIPVIMLTARAALEDKIAGYQTGADDYIAKPFQMAELKVRVANLIEQRRKLRERFSREVTLQPHDISIVPLDEKFLNRAIEIIEKHIDDENFGITGFRDEMFMTRSTLFRKLHALTNQSPGEFIRTIRLKRAANLLKQNFGNVTQVSYEVGFNNLTSFNRSFRKLFGVSPAEYRKQNLVNHL